MANDSRQLDPAFQVVLPSRSNAREKRFQVLLPVFGYNRLVSSSPARKILESMIRQEAMEQTHMIDHTSLLQRYMIVDNYNYNPPYVGMSRPE